MKNFLLDILFPKFCLGCHREETYLCQDCLALIGISNKVFKTCEELSGLYCATDYENFIVKRLITKCKFEPFARELSEILASIIIIYLQNLEKQPEFTKRRDGFVLIPVPLYKKRLRWRGFNQAEEIAKALSGFLKIPLVCGALEKFRETLPQLNLPQDKRRENIKGVFACEKLDLIRGKKILLVDDVFTTGSTMEEAAEVLKQAGAKEVWGVAVAGQSLVV